jgi:polar amino acid transport system substrate-binding protein
MPRTTVADRSRLRLAAIGICLAALSGCDDVRFPRDPNGTLEGVLATGRMRVAAADHVPWVIVEGDGAPSGAEVELVEAFARDLGVAIDWQRAPAFEALEALERGDADLAIGGYVNETLAALGGAAPSYAYFSEALIVAAEPGRPVPEDLEGRSVHVPPELLAEELIRDRGGLPVSQMGEETDLVALPHWDLTGRALVPTGIVLQRQNHVMAVPQGENAWLMRLDRFLRGRADGFAADLREHAR